MIMKGKTPTLISGVPKVAFSDATTRPHASATRSAPASTGPRAAQIVGLRSSPIRRKRPTNFSVPKWRCTSGTSPAKPARLPPLEKTFSCEEASTTQRTSSSSRARSKASIAPWRSSLDSELRVSGSSRVMVATPSATSYLTFSFTRATSRVGSGTSYSPRTLSPEGQAQLQARLLRAQPAAQLGAQVQRRGDATAGLRAHARRRHRAVPEHEPDGERAALVRPVGDAQRPAGEQAAQLGPGDLDRAGERLGRGRLDRRRGRRRGRRRPHRRSGRPRGRGHGRGRGAAARGGRADRRAAGAAAVGGAEEGRV